MLSARGGEERELASVVDELWGNAEIEGISLLGGEPFAQAPALALLAQQATSAGLSVMIFSGFTLAELAARQDKATDELLASCDLLVDGPYQSTEPDNERRWIGSQNQGLHFLTKRYHADQACFHEPNNVEIRWRPKAGQGATLTVNGWPSTSSVLDPRLGRRRHE